MACCVAVLQLMAWVARRAGLIDVADAPPDIRRTAPILALMAGVEAVLVLAWLRWAADGGGAAGHSHHPVDAAATPMSVWAALAATVGATIVVAGVALAGRRRRPARVSVGLTLALAAVALAQLGPASQVLTVIALELTTVCAPLCLVGMKPTTRDSDDVWVVARITLTAAVGLAVTAVVASAHIGPMHERIWLVGYWWALPVALAVSSWFWLCALRFRMPAIVRLSIIALVLEVGAVLAVAMLLNPTPTTSVGAFGLSPLADQHLAGLLMIVIDAGLVAIWFGARGSSWRAHTSVATS